MNPNDTNIQIIDDKVFEKIKLAVDNLVDFVKPTYGPASNKVIISKLMYKMVLDDGVQIARDYKAKGEVENSIVNVIREVAISTNDKVGDGTTSSLIILQGIINEVSRKTRWDGRKIELELKKALEEVKAELREKKYEIESKEDLEKVARISFDDDRISKMIADTYHELGKNGIITIEKSSTEETHIETSDGIKFNTGYLSPYMVTNPNKMETEMQKPLILITDYRLTQTSDVIGILNKMAEESKQNLVLIAENVEQTALSTMVINHTNVVNPQTQKPGVVTSVAISAPKGMDKKTFLEDLAMMTGARLISETKGDKMENVTLDDLGSADKIIVSKEETVIVSPKGDKGEIATAISGLENAINNEKNQKERQSLEKRLATFTNTIAVIKVGAATENEQKALKYKVEDAVNAVKQAYNGGIVCGAGIALANCKTSSSILNEALSYPSRQLRENMALDGEPVTDTENIENVVTGEKGNYLEVGVVDPVEVLIAGIESAVSIASVLITTKGIIVETQKESK